jgi:protein TonB
MGALTHRSDNRIFHYAVVASIVFHGVLLSLAPRQPSKTSSALPGPIVARLVQPAAVAPHAEPQKPQAEPQKPTPPAAEPPPPSPSPKPSPIAKPAPKAPSKPAAPSAPSKPSPSPTIGAEPAPSAPAAPATPAPGPVAKADPQPAAPSVEADAGSLAQYRMQLIGVAKRYKRYPRVAMDNNWEGDVVVRMVIGANGMISSISVKTSSGHEILDKQAIDMFTKAKPLVPIPGALRGKEFTIEVRAIYNLKDPDSG